MDAPDLLPRPQRFRIRRLLRIVLLLALTGALLIGVINWWVWRTGHAHIVALADARPAQAIIVLGAQAYPNGGVSPILADRLETALALYRAGKAPKILLSGDHGQTTYDEVNAMRRYLADQGVPAQDLFMDHAGFDTYSTMARAGRVFDVHAAIVVTNGFHLPRALYLANRLGVGAEGVVADRRVYPEQNWYEAREMGARLKALFDVLRHRQPRFLGPVISITGDGRSTVD